jgi:hypothetical protein
VAPEDSSGYYTSVLTNETIQLLWTIIRDSANVPTYGKYFNDYNKVKLEYGSNATELFYWNYPYPLAAVNVIFQNIFAMKQILINDQNKRRSTVESCLKLQNF